MIVSNEPGYYEDNAFGIRIENLLHIKEADTPFKFGDQLYFGFERLTMIPLQRKMILTDVSGVSISNMHVHLISPRMHLLMFIHTTRCNLTYDLMSSDANASRKGHFKYYKPYHVSCNLMLASVLQVLSKKEMDWVNNYHTDVWRKVAPRLQHDTELLAWVKNNTRPL